MTYSKNIRGDFFLGQLRVFESLVTWKKVRVQKTDYVGSDSKKEP